MRELKKTDKDKYLQDSWFYTERTPLRMSRQEKNVIIHLYNIVISDIVKVGDHAPAYICNKIRWHLPTNPLAVSLGFQYMFKHMPTEDNKLQQFYRHYTFKKNISFRDNCHYECDTWWDHMLEPEDYSAENQAKLYKVMNEQRIKFLKNLIRKLKR
jgi:hypothetical protein